MISGVRLVLPELFQLLLVTVLLAQIIFQKNHTQSALKWLPLAAGTGVILSFLSLDQSGLILARAYQVDHLSQFFKMTVSFGFFLTVFNGYGQPSLETDKRTDYFLLLSLSTWALMLLCSCVELMSIYLALELASFSLFPLVPLRTRDKTAAEAAIKYIFFGGAATAIGLFGFSCILAARHNTYLLELTQMTWTWGHSPMAVVGLTLFLCGILFKLAFFPFHFWAPDVYEGSGNETAAYIATLPKVGAVVILLRFSPIFKPGLDITIILTVLAAVSMTYGNLAALVQQDIKRILGYSAIAHAGYLMAGVLAGGSMGASATAYYALAYVIMNFACFWVVCRESGDGKNLKLEDLRGLSQRSPALALVMAIGAVSLVGLPPTAGFMGKFFVLTAAWNRGLHWLVIIGAANVAIGLFYYLNLIRYVYAKETTGPLEKASQMEDFPKGLSLPGGLFLGALIILLGIFPDLAFGLLHMSR